MKPTYLQRAVEAYAQGYTMRDLATELDTLDVSHGDPAYDARATLRRLFTEAAAVMDDLGDTLSRYHEDAPGRTTMEQMLAETNRRAAAFAEQQIPFFTRIEAS